MSWIKIDDQFADHPKVLQAGPLASWMYVCGLTYAGRYLTDGFIPAGQVRKLADVDNATKEEKHNMREKTVYLSVCMTPQQLAKLSELAKRTERTKGAVLRLLIDGTSVEELERLATRGPARAEGGASS